MGISQPSAQTSRRLTAVVSHTCLGTLLVLDTGGMLITVCSETNSVACQGAPGVSNTAGAALWTIDYALQAATLGIKELFFHEGIGFRYNFVSIVHSTSIFAYSC